MLEHLFSSKTRVKLLQLFLNDPSQPYYLRELARQLKTQLNSVRREVDNLEKIGIVKSVELNEEELVELDQVKAKSKKAKRKKQGSKKYFVANTEFLLYPELKALLIKAQILLEQDFIKKMVAMPRLQLFLLSGVFVGLENFATDMLIVGMLNKDSIAKLVKKFEKDLGRPINYTIMTPSEFKYRQDITDRFMFDILEASKIVIVDKFNAIS